jgi:hypothetical protein
MATIATYVMIVMSCFGGYVTGCSVSTQEFSSKATCDAASKSINDQRAMNYSSKTWCMPK